MYLVQIMSDGVPGCTYEVDPPESYDDAVELAFKVLKSNKNPNGFLDKEQMVTMTMFSFFRQNLGKMTSIFAKPRKMAFHAINLVHMIQKFACAKNIKRKSLVRFVAEHSMNQKLNTLDQKATSLDHIVRIAQS